MLNLIGEMGDLLDAKYDLIRTSDKVDIDLYNEDSDGGIVISFTLPSIWGHV